MKYIITLISLFLCSIISYLQIPSYHIEWQNTIGGDNSERMENSFLKLPDGGYLIGANSNSDISGDKQENSRGEYDYWILRIDSIGNILWQKTIGGNQDDFLTTMALAKDGGYICAGWSNSNISGEKTEDSKGSSDYWIVKLDENAEIEWQRTIGGNGADVIVDIKVLEDSSYVCAGRSNSNISGDKTMNSFNGSYDYWIVKISKSGEIIWDRTIGGNDLDLLTSFNITNDGGFICVGASTSNLSGYKSENSKGSSDYWVVKLNANGQVLWENTIGGNLAEIIPKVLQTTDGGYICGGSSYSDISGDKTEGVQGSVGCDAWVVKLSNSGQIEWQNTIGGNNYDYLNILDQLSDGTYLLGFNSISSISYDKLENSASSDLWIINLNSQGEIKWQKTITANSYDVFLSYYPISNESFVFCGLSDSNTSGDKTEDTHNESDDIWVLKLNILKTDLSLAEVISPSSSGNLTSTENLVVAVKNESIDTVTSFQVGYTLSNGPAIIEDVNFTLYPDSIYIHTFSSSLNLEQEQLYQVKVFSILEEDLVKANDTIVADVHHFSTIDMGVESAQYIESICRNDVSIPVKVKNYGTNQITSATIVVEVNNIIEQEISWTANTPLNNGEFEWVDISLSNLSIGLNNIKFYTLDPNNEMDLQNYNDSFTISIFTENTSVLPYNLHLQFDNYPQETTWLIQNSLGDTIYTGGPYSSSLQNTEVIEPLCLPNYACYTFKIFDAFGDGICCNYGTGSYELKNENGASIISMIDNNWLEEEQEFCIPLDTCYFDATISVSNSSEGNSNGSISILVNAEPLDSTYLSSIDGGAVFNETGFYDALEIGSYHVVVINSEGCLYQEIINIDYLVSNENWQEYSNLIKVIPNPTNNVTSILIQSNFSKKPYIIAYIYDAMGKPIEKLNLIRMDDNFYAKLDLSKYPESIYFIQIENTSLFQKLVKIK